MYEKLKPKEAVRKIREYFTHIIDSKVTVSFSSHTSPALLKDIKLARQADMENKPDKVSKLLEDGANKQYTPPVISFIFEAFVLDLVIEDISNIQQLVGGVRIIIGDCEIDIRDE